MPIGSRSSSPHLAISVAGLSAFVGGVLVLGFGCLARAQDNNSPGPAIQLQTYTALDQSASAGVPQEWKVTKGEQTVIQMSGPQGETIFLGSTAIAHNGAFQLGRPNAGGVDISMPYVATLSQKLTMIVQNGAVQQGKPTPQIAITSATPLPLPPALGQCGRFLGNLDGDKGAMKFMAAMCSLPLDSAGFYKNIILLAQAPAAIASQDAPTAAAVFRSYRIAPGMLQRKLAPFTPAPVMMPGGGGGGSSPVIDDSSAECFDLVVIRETPKYLLPRKCGGLKPD